MTTRPTASVIVFTPSAVWFPRSGFPVLLLSMLLPVHLGEGTAFATTELRRGPSYTPHLWLHGGYTFCAVTADEFRSILHLKHGPLPIRRSPERSSFAPGLRCILRFVWSHSPKRLRYAPDRSRVCATRFLSECCQAEAADVMKQKKAAVRHRTTAELLLSFCLYNALDDPLVALSQITQRMPCAPSSVSSRKQ